MSVILVVASHMRLPRHGLGQMSVQLRTRTHYFRFVIDIIG